MLKSKAAALLLVVSSISASYEAAAASGAMLSWTVPTARENGQPLALSELSGYELYYTTDDPSVTGTIKVLGGSTTSYTVQNLAAGNYHFAMSAVDSTGLKSKLSTMADVTIQAAAGSSSSSTTTTSVGTTGTTTSGTSSTNSGTTSGSTVSSTTVASGTTSSSTTTASVALTNLKISWIPPKIRADGTPLNTTDLSGFKINLYNVSNLALTAQATVSGGSTNTYTLNNIKAGTYAVELAAVDIGGRVSKNVYSFVTVQ